MCILTTSKVIAGWIPICDSVHSWPHHIAASIGDRATSTMTTISLSFTLSLHLPCPKLIMLSTRLQSDKCKFLSYWCDLIWGSNSRSPACLKPNSRSPDCDACALPIRPRPSRSSSSKRQSWDQLNVTWVCWGSFSFLVLESICRNFHSRHDTSSHSCVWELSNNSGVSSPDIRCCVSI